MISTSFRIVRDNTLFFLSLIAVLVVLSVVDQMGYIKSSQSVVTVILWLSVMWIVQRGVLFNLRLHEKHPDPAMDKSLPGFLAKGFVLTAFGVVLSVPFMIMAFGTTSGPGGGMSGTGYLILMLGSVICISVVYALLGTWLPAAVQGQEKGLGAALSRGLKSFFPVFFKIVAVNAVCLGLFLAAFAAFGSQIDAFRQGPTVASILFDALGGLVGVVISTCTAVVLAQAYRQHEATRVASPTA